MDLTTGNQYVEPELNVARFLHSSCELGNSIYVFCGLQDHYLNSIERLETSNESCSERRWKLIEPDLRMFPARCRTQSIPLNEKEILVFGGSTQLGIDDVPTRGIFRLDSASDTIAKVKEDESSWIEIFNDAHEAKLIGNNRVVAIAVGN